MLGKHLLGLYEKALDPKDDWTTRLKKAKSLGFDYVEISVDETDERLARLDWTREEKENLRRACYEAGIGIQSMCLSGHRRFPFGSKDPQVRARAHEIMEKAIDFCHDTGIRVIQLAGYDLYYEESTAESVKLFREAMAWSAKKAEEKQIMLAMEIMDTPFLNSISKHMAYEGMIQSPWYKVYPDIGNLSAWPENDVDFELQRGIHSIVQMHLKDTIAVTKDFEGKFKCVTFGEGCVDFPKRFGQLEKLGYCGPYTIEMWYAEGKDDLAEVAKVKAWMEKQFAEGTK